MYAIGKSPWFDLFPPFFLQEKPTPAPMPYILYEIWPVCIDFLYNFDHFAILCNELGEKLPLLWIFKWNLSPLSHTIIWLKIQVLGAKMTPYHHLNENTGFGW